MRPDVERRAQRERQVLGDRDDDLELEREREEVGRADVVRHADVAQPGAWPQGDAAVRRERVTDARIDAEDVDRALTGRVRELGADADGEAAREERVEGEARSAVRSRAELGAAGAEERQGGEVRSVGLDRLRDAEEPLRGEGDRARRAEPRRRGARGTPVLAPRLRRSIQRRQDGCDPEGLPHAAPPRTLACPNGTTTGDVRGEECAPRVLGGA
jgi:hypothetical protein